MQWGISAERRQAWAATTGSGGTAMMVFAADHLHMDIPPMVSWGALSLGATLGLLSVYLWTHIAFGIVLRRGAEQALPQNPALQKSKITPVSAADAEDDWFAGLVPIKSPRRQWLRQTVLSSLLGFFLGLVSNMTVDLTMGGPVSHVLHCLSQSAGPRWDVCFAQASRYGTTGNLLPPDTGQETRR
jgi:hypothetical protein